MTETLKAQQFPLGSRWQVEHDGFVGTVIGHYTTLEGKEGINLQQDGTRVVHVYGEKWLRSVEAKTETGRDEGLEKAARGWIDWNGGPQPVPDGTLVDFKVFPDHEFFARHAEHWDWGKKRFPHNPSYGSIIAYRRSAKETQ